jgi:hypothetical protein
MEVGRLQQVRTMVKVFQTKFIQQLCHLSAVVWSVHNCPPIKQMTPLTHTFPIHRNKLMDFSRVNVFVLKNWITEHTSQLAGLVIGMVPYQAL